MANPSFEGRFAVADDGRQLALVCWGEGAPTVIAETGGPNIDEWSREAQVGRLAEHGRVCTYDRAGTGASDPAPNEKRGADDVIRDLHALLDAASVPGPYVLLGRSFGGMVVTYYAQQRPTDVLGVVVFDTPAPSAEFTEENEPGLVWNYPGNVEHLDVVGGFENRFAKDPPHIDVPLLVITPADGESSPEDQSFWLQVSDDSGQVTPTCKCYADDVVRFIASLN
jgi:pimeloyl-ACP methyl ester carboxylesterase